MSVDAAADAGDDDMEAPGDAGDMPQESVGTEVEEKSKQTNYQSDGPKSRKSHRKAYKPEDTVEMDEDMERRQEEIKAQRKIAIKNKLRRMAEAESAEGGEDDDVEDALSKEGNELCNYMAHSE